MFNLKIVRDSLRVDIKNTPKLHLYTDNITPKEIFIILIN